jgi:DNA polymerase-3 subunit delta
VEFLTHIAEELLLSLLKQQKRSIIRFEGALVDDKTLDNELNGFDMFSGKRLLIIQDCDKLQKNASEVLQSYFSKANDDVSLLLIASTVNASTNFYKKTEKFGVVFSPDQPKPKDFESLCVEWIIKKSTALNKTITPSNAQLLYRHLSADYIGLNNEIDKLSVYTGDRKEIREEDIAALVQAIPQATAWQAADAILQGNPSEALRLCHLLMQSGTALIAMIRQFRRSFQTGFEIISLLTNGGSPADISIKFPQMKGFILDKNIQSARNYGLEKFRSAIIALDTSEFEAKDSAGNDELLMEKLIVKLVYGIPTQLNYGTKK